MTSRAVLVIIILLASTISCGVQVAPMDAPTPTAAPTSAEQQAAAPAPRLHTRAAQRADIMTTVGKLRLRECAGTHCAEIAVLPSGTAVIVLGYAAAPDGGWWARVSAGGALGYVNARWLE
jgi:hypothetical protein